MPFGIFHRTLKANSYKDMDSYLIVDTDIDRGRVQGCLLPTSPVIPRREMFTCTPDFGPNIPVVHLAEPPPDPPVKERKQRDYKRGVNNRRKRKYTKRKNFGVVLSKKKSPDVSVANSNIIDLKANHISANDINESPFINSIQDFEGSNQTPFTDTRPDNEVISLECFEKLDDSDYK